LESANEDYGQVVIYQGTIPYHEKVFKLDKHHLIELDKHHLIEIDKVFPVCGNTYRMLHDTRFAPHFEFGGQWENHCGIFEGGSIPFDDNQQEVKKATCGCC